MNLEYAHQLDLPAGDSLPSHVLTAIGLNAEEASGTIRFSLGKENTKDEIDYVVNKLSYI